VGLDVGVVTKTMLSRPQGAAYDFAWTLPEDSDSWGDGNAFGFKKNQALDLPGFRFVA